MKILTSTLFFLLLCFNFNLKSQCVSNTSNIYSFSTNGVQYELIKENKNWTSAASCATSRGGFLAEINSATEQDSIYANLLQAGVNNSSTIAQDGGGAAYVWIGGNDISSEGRWIWNGDNSGAGTHFWQGARSGNAIAGLYNNWGNEPDNFNNNQDGLGIALSNWPFGTASQWNDVNTSNSLYYLIEFSSSTGLLENKSNSFELYPNPVQDFIYINATKRYNGKKRVRMVDINGKEILEKALEPSLDVSEIRSGTYYLQITGKEGVIFEESIIIQH